MEIEVVSSLDYLLSPPTVNYFMNHLLHCELLPRVENLGWNSRLDAFANLMIELSYYGKSLATSTAVRSNSVLAFLNC